MLRTSGFEEGILRFRSVDEVVIDITKDLIKDNVPDEQIIQATGITLEQLAALKKQGETKNE